MTDALPQPDPLAPSERRFAAVAGTLAHWDRLRAGRPMPGRDEIDPRAIAEALEYLFIAEPVAPGVARLRLAGQHLHHLLGMEPRGMPLCALFDGAARAEVAGALDQVVGHGLRVILPVQAAGVAGLASRPTLEGLMALMPLAGPDGRLHRILGVLQTRGGPGRGPRRLSLAAAPRMVAGAQPAATPQAGRPVLRVIRGGLA